MVHETVATSKVPTRMGPERCILLVRIYLQATTRLIILYACATATESRDLEILSLTKCRSEYGLMMLSSPLHLSNGYLHHGTRLKGHESLLILSVDVNPVMYLSEAGTEFAWKRV